MSSRDDVSEFLATETGNRHFSGMQKRIVVGLLILWSCFQLWYASPLPFILNFATLNEDQAKFIHLAFAAFLAFALFPGSAKASRDRMTPLDWVFGFIAASAALYLLIVRNELANRLGAPTTMDMVMAVAGILTLLEATRRSLGLPLLIVAVVFLSYTFLGQYMPDVISHKGASLSKVASHQWLTTEGVFGVALGVSASFVFLFVLLGSLLDRAGAGNYLIMVSFALLGHMRGGPAKAAVVASGLSGIISGSSIANVVTTGTFTIPLMKRVGFPATKAGAVEVAASTNGQLTPPIMGAAAFLMVEYVGVPYIDVIKHAILPALISYIALVYIVHLEAVKLGMKGIERLHKPTVAQRMMTWLSSTLVLFALGAVVYYGSHFVEANLGELAPWVLFAASVALYVALVKYASLYPDLPTDDAAISLDKLPEVKPTVVSGLYFSVPIIVLLWALAVKQYSPQQSAFYAVAFLILVVITHRPIKAWFRSETNLLVRIVAGWDDLIEGMITGARNMVGIGVATAAAGIIVGTVTLTGLGQMMTEFVEYISGGSLILILIFTAIICIILGMGLPTTANYIVVSTLMAPVIVTLGAENGLVIPLIAAHLFVFYFGILADDTPPVGLAAFAAAAIGRADPIKTGIQGFTYDIRTAVLPFMFIFNTQLLLIGIESVFDLLLTIVSALIAILTFSAATQGYWLTKSRYWESAVLLLVAFTLFRPGYWWDQIYPPFEEKAPAALVQELETMKAGEYLQIRVEGETLEGDQVDKVVQLLLSNDAGNFETRLSDIGLTLSESEMGWNVDAMTFGSEAEKAGIDFDWQITAVVTESDRLPKELMFIPALLLLFGLGRIQIARRQREGEANV